MNYWKNALLAVLLFTAFTVQGQPFAPVNKQATPGARKLLAYIYSVSGVHLLSGQHNYNEQPNRFSDSAFAITGKFPVGLVPRMERLAVDRQYAPERTGSVRQRKDADPRRDQRRASEIRRASSAVLFVG